MSAGRWPTELRLSKDRRALSIAFDDGAAYELSAELLRVTSPSAEVQGHSPSERKTFGGKRNVMILAFDDMHSTGIYSWTFLHELGRDASKRFQDYCDDLAAKGLTRDKAGVK